MCESVSEETKSAVSELITFAAISLVMHRDSDYPHEAVGILCSDGSIYPLINQARSAHRFEVSQPLVKEAIGVLTQRGMEPIAVYHSHPTSSSGPSKRDIMLMETMPGSLSIIIGQDGIAAWLWDGGLQSVTRINLPTKETVDV